MSIILSSINTTFYLSEFVLHLSLHPLHLLRDVLQSFSSSTLIRLILIFLLQKLKQLRHIVQILLATVSENTVIVKTSSSLCVCL